MPSQVPLRAKIMEINIIFPTLLVTYLAALAGTVRRTNINNAPTTGTVTLVAIDKRTKKKIEINFPLSPSALAPTASNESNFIVL